MKALVLKGIETVSYEEVPIPKCPQDGMLLKIEAVGLCGSDVRTYHSGHSDVTYPAILGHENVGKIVEIGKNAQTDLRVGDRVTLYPGIPCGKCRYCMQGLHSLCLDQKNIGLDVPGGFAEYMAVPGEVVDHGLIIPVPDHVKSEDMVIVELLSSIVGAHEFGRVGMASNVLIIGTGPAGCLHSELARLNGAKTILVADFSDERLEMAKKFSGTHFINPQKEDLKAKVMELTGGVGMDTVIVAAPSTQASAQALEYLANRGTLMVFGGLPKTDPFAKMNLNLIHYKELTVIGNNGYSLLQFQRAFDIISAGMIHSDITTHVLPLSEMEQGVKLIQQGKALKVVLKP